MMANDKAIFTVHEGAFMVVRGCRFCKHIEKVRKGIPGVGRGYGMREGNKARGRMIQHVKEAHPEQYAASRPTKGTE